MDKTNSIIVTINGTKRKLQFKNIQEIGNSLRDTREQAGLSCAEINKLTNISLGTIHNIENGVGNPHLTNIISYGTALKMETIPLLFDSDGIPFQEHFDTYFTIDAELSETIQSLSHTQRKALDNFLKILIH